MGSADTHEKKVAKYVPHTYGETEMGGTQMLFLAGVPFEDLGYPRLRDRSYAATSETIQHALYGGMVAPAAVLGGLLFVAHRSTRNDREED